MRTLIPAIDRALSPGGFNLEPFYPLIMSGYLLTAPGIVGMVVGFLVLDERDARTLTALRVTPLPIYQYLGYRLTAPLVAGTIISLAAYPLVGLTPMPYSTLVPIVLLASLSAPTLELIVATAVALVALGLVGDHCLELVAQICPRWNRLTSWLRQLDQQKAAAIEGFAKRKSTSSPRPIFPAIFRGCSAPAGNVAIGSSGTCSIEQD